jgi:serine/threonine-protein kinase
MAAAPADRNLLLGLIALQNGLIVPDQLLGAFRAWALDKACSLADHLIALGHLNPSQRAAVEVMAELHVAKHGDVEHSLAAIPAGRSTRESLADLGDPDIGATLDHVGSGHGSTEDEDADRTASYAIGMATSDGQRFRVLRPHAKGGLGAVFVALDTELLREVALKQILEKHADDPVSRQRFLLEAEITGGLEHPGIVPVYGLGTYGDGRPYYAMRFIKGDSLKDALDRFHADGGLKEDAGRRSLELRKLLRRFLDVCNAIEYAHSRGVLHRDIKPGNIIVGKHGETLVVDWGLAKPLGRAEPGSDTTERMLMPSSASGSAETLPGSALGTPAYMSPEQARGELDRLGPRSDVYSLGATLYCLLTGRLPFEGDDIGALLGKVQLGEFARPRQLDPALDPALEAVCLQAMALEPGDRYGSCRALAEDVERWMADEPVKAWSEPWTRTVLRWLTRHRAGVTAAAAAGIVALVGLAVVAAMQAQGRAVLEIKNRELAAANVKVQARYDLAVEAIKTFHTGVSEDFLLKEDQFRDLRNRLLKSASEFYERLGALLKAGTDLASRQALLQANYEVAALAEKVGRKDDALAMHRLVLAGRAALAREPGAGAGVAVDLARSLLAVGEVLEATGKAGEARAAYERAGAAVSAPGGAAPLDSAARAALAASERRRGWLLYSIGQTADGLAAQERARDLQDALAEADPRDKDVQYERARTYSEIGNILSSTGRSAEALKAYQAALAIRQKLADDHPPVTEFRSRLAYGHYNLGLVLSATGKPGEAEAEYRKALVIRQKLADDHPSVAEFRSNLADSHVDLGVLLSRTGRPSQAETEYRAALALNQKLADDHPAVTQFRSSLAGSYENLAILLVLNQGAIQELRPTVLRGLPRLRSRAKGKVGSCSWMAPKRNGRCDMGMTPPLTSDSPGGDQPKEFGFGCRFQVSAAPNSLESLSPCNFRGEIH